VAITVALLDPALATVLTGVRFDRFVDAKVLLEAADTSELLVTVYHFTGPDLVHSACPVVLLILESVVCSIEGCEASVARLGRLFDLPALHADESGDRVSPLVASLRVWALKHLFSVDII